MVAMWSDEREKKTKKNENKTKGKTTRKGYKRKAMGVGQELRLDGFHELSRFLLLPRFASERFPRGLYTNAGERTKFNLAHVLRQLWLLKVYRLSSAKNNFVFVLLLRIFKRSIYIYIYICIKTFISIFHCVNKPKWKIKYVGTK